MRLAIVLVALAGGADPKLVGTWLLHGQPFLTLNASGSGVMEDGPVRWRVEGSQLVLADDEDGVDKVQYVLAGDTLTLTMGGARIQLTRAGKRATGQKAGSQRGDEADAERAQPRQPPGSTPQGRVAAAPAGGDQLSRLLMSSAWCWLRYASGNTSTERIVFAANGTWSSNRESEISGRNDYAGTSAHSVGVSGASGQWAVRNGQLHMSEPPETPQLVAVPLQVTRNSNGYPILTADGKEYSQCN